MRALFPLVALAACTPTAVDEFRSVLPDDRLVLDTAGMRSAMRGLGEPSENATEALETSEGINDLLLDVLGTIDEVTSFPPSWQPTERLATWGPWEDGGIEGRLWVRERPVGGYGWAFEFRFVGEGDDAWRSPIVGRIDAGATEAASSGTMILDTAVWAEFDPAVVAGGGGVVSYALDEDGASAEILLDDYAEQVGDDTVDAAVAWTSAVAGGGSLEFVAVGDVTGDPASADEVVTTYTRWAADGSGRTDAAATGGDLGLQVFTETDCWDPSLASTFFENTWEGRTEGDPASCAFAAE